MPRLWRADKYYKRRGGLVRELTSLSPQLPRVAKDAADTAWQMLMDFVPPRQFRKRPLVLPNRFLDFLDAVFDVRWWRFQSLLMPAAVVKLWR